MDDGTPDDLRPAKRHRDGRQVGSTTARCTASSKFVAIPRHPGAAVDACVGTLLVAQRHAEFDHPR